MYGCCDSPPRGRGLATDDGARSSREHARAGRTVARGRTDPPARRTQQPRGSTNSRRAARPMRLAQTAVCFVAVVAVAQSCGDHVGHPPAKGLDPQLDSASDITTIDPGIELTSGYVDSWVFFNGRPNAPMAFQIWRKEGGGTGGTADTWTLHCQDEIVTPATHGPVTVSSSGCSTALGDAVGWFQAGTGIIPANTYAGADCQLGSNPKCVVWKYPTSKVKEGATLSFNNAGQLRTYSVGVVLCSAWGMPFLIALFVCALLYVGGGFAFSHYTLGKRLGADGWKEMHPHVQLWSQLSGLVLDGAKFAQTHARAKLGGTGGSSGGGVAVKKRESAESLLSGANEERGGQAAASGAAESGEDSDGDGLVE